MRHVPSFFAAGHSAWLDSQLLLPQKNINLAINKVLSVYTQEPPKSALGKLVNVLFLTFITRLKAIMTLLSL